MFCYCIVHTWLGEYWKAVAKKEAILAKHGPNMKNCRYHYLILNLILILILNCLGWRIAEWQIQSLISSPGCLMGRMILVKNIIELL